MFRSLRLPALLLLAMSVLLLAVPPLEGQLRREDESEATRRAEDSRRRGESAEEATRSLQTEFRATPPDLVRVLSAAGYREGEVTAAVAVALRGDLAEVSRVLRVERWSAARAAQGLRQAFPALKGADLWGAMTREGYPPAELAEVLPVLFLGDALSAAEAMRAGGWTPQDTARQLRIQYGLGAAAVLEVMRDAGWSINERAQGVVSQFSFPHPDHLRALLNSSARPWENVPTAMNAAGMPNVPYTRDRYEINETRIGMSGLRVDDGILHRPWGSVSDPSDGVVWVVGQGLERPEVRFFLGDVEGQIRGFTKEGDRDRVELFFERVGTSPQVLSIRTLYSSSRSWRSWTPMTSGSPESCRSRSPSSRSTPKPESSTETPATGTAGPVDRRTGTGISCRGPDCGSTGSSPPANCFLASFRDATRSPAPAASWSGGTCWSRSEGARSRFEGATKTRSSMPRSASWHPPTWPMPAGTDIDSIRSP